ncbi:hypothetical protein E4T56_gene8948 [Termitomyces sp. T112]|nr:hypothetical protein E4T56_gene8948 [Termitomyces sp. T112]KAH0583683.1 hypothetical protein H2248_009296 [Termitomyces sp. 'cryptogamus']
MANGPPTPPPTTETEIQDQARVIAEIPPTATTPLLPASAQPDAFQAAFPVIVDLASQSNFQGLIQVAENANLQSDADTNRRLTRLLVLGPLVLAYLIVDDLPPARFALTQLSEDISSTPLSHSLFELLASTWDRKHANVYLRARELNNLVQQPSFFDEQLGSVLTALVTIFVEAFRRRTVILLATSYASLPAPLAAMYLGMKQDELLTAAQNEGWSYNGSTNVFVPKIEASIATRMMQPPPSSLSSFHFVTNSVAKLEL